MTMMLRTVTLEDVPLCAAIEARCYPHAEAASAEQIAARARHYPEGFLVAERGGQVLGFINGAASDQDDLANEALKDLVDHDPDGANLIIFSLAVHPEQQRRGIAQALMAAYIERARVLGKRSMLLLCKAELLAFYQRFGFVDQGRSASTHGGAAWHQMRLAL
jgi:ribosomal protein S18 acetylase RimI-like enzyme